MLTWKGSLWPGLLALCGCQGEPCAEDSSFIGEEAMWAEGWQSDSAGNQRPFDTDIMTSSCGTETATLALDCRSDGFTISSHVAQLSDPDDPDNNLKELHLATSILLNGTQGVQTVERTAAGGDGVYVRVDAHGVEETSLASSTLIVDDAVFGSHFRGHFEMTWTDNGELYDPGYSFYTGAGELSGSFDVQCPDPLGDTD
ncbi:MAG: hypothetical protein ACI9VR_001686 [Cognaticolwellia sp.]|jgi:hypothetical protein